MYLGDTPKDTPAPLAGSTATKVAEFGGRGEIRTHGTSRSDSFQDCCNKPGSATLPKN